MKLNRLCVEQLRQFRQPLQIADLTPGINLFCGPNESGKSTLVRAIRAAFFERHRSSSVDDLQPWGDSSASPQVMLEFEFQGNRWQLQKSFLHRKRCDLQVDGQHFSGEVAEEKLAELLGFQFPGRGASKAEHWGIPGLLWIEQGEGQEVRQSVAYAGEHLKSALGSALGEVASSAGDELIGMVDEQRSVLLTRTGRPTGEYAQVVQRYGELQSGLQELDDKIAGYRLQVDRLGELRRQQVQDDTDRPWDEFRRQARQTQTRLEEVEGWITEQQREQQELQSCQTTLDLVRDQLAGFEAQAGELRKRERANQKAIDALSSLNGQQGQIDARLTEAQDAYQQAREAVRLARQHEQRAVLEREAAQLARQLTDLDRNLAKAQQLQGELLDLRGQLQANRIDAASLKRLQKLYGQLSESKIRQQGIATRLQFDLLSGQSIHLNGATLSGHGERLLLEPTEVEIAGVGRLQIQPGGEDLADLARQQTRLEDDIAALQKTLAVDSLAQAEQRAELSKTLQADIVRGEALLVSHAPQGIDALLVEQRAGLEHQGELEEQLVALPPAEGQGVTLAVAEAQLEAAGQQLKAAEQDATAHQGALILAEQVQSNAATELQRLQDDLKSADRLQREAKANQQLIDLRADQTRLQASIDTRSEQIDAARPDILRQDIERFGKTADELEKAANQRRLELASLQSRLETQGAEGLEEQRAELALEVERLARRQGELQRRAAALELLLGLLKDKRQALTRRLQAPLQKHLNHYLQLLFPLASLAVDENLIPGQLTRPGSNGQEISDFDALSFGAREQMGLISRLAYADLLKEAGRPTLIILDDALVHSDQQRLAQMKRILFDAAQRHQILLFTCHPENWRDLGVAPRDMQSLKVSA